ncbi:hypothetical protein [Helicobacter sp. 23-1045]
MLRCFRYRSNCLAMTKNTQDSAFRFCDFCARFCDFYVNRRI